MYVHVEYVEIGSVRAGIYSTDTALNFLQAYLKEDDWAVWDVIATDLGQLLRVFANDQFEDQLAPFGRTLVKTQLERLGWIIKKSDSHFDKLLRPTIIGLAARFKDTQTLAEATKRFKQHSSWPIDPDLRSVVYGTIARYGGTAEYETLLKLYKTTEMAEEKNRLAAGLSGFRKAALIKKNIELIRSREVRLQEAPSWIARLLLNKDAKYLTLYWLKQNF